MGCDVNFSSTHLGKVMCLALVLVAQPLFCAAKELSNAQISVEIKKEANRAIIEAFLKAELSEVNKYVTRPLLSQHPSLIFFINQVDKGPLNSLFFLEEWVHKLQDAQNNIDSFPYLITFSAGEKTKILGLVPVTKRIISYGIPLMKRDFYKVVVTARELSAKKSRQPVELIRDVEFRNAIYRHASSSAQELNTEMGKLSEGELICMRLGWVLQQVTVTRVWLQVTGNDLPEPNDYMVYRKKRSEYWDRRLKQIYPE
jgi:hypothetical protein